MITDNNEIHAFTKRGGFSIPEFCRYFGISTPTYYKMKARGQGPHEMRLSGAVIRISAEAVREWVRQRENPIGDEILAVEAQKAKLKQRSQTAVAGGR